MFVVNVPIGIVVGLVALRVLPRLTRPEGADTRIDVLGIALIGGAFAGGVLALSQAGSQGLTAPMVLAGLAGGVLLVALYLAHAARVGPRAVIELRLFRQQGFAACIGGNALNGIMLYPLLFLIPLYFQQARELGGLTAGALLVSEAIGASAGFRLGGSLTARVGARRLFPLGCLVYGVAVLPFAVDPAGAPVALLAAAAAVAGLSFGTAGGSLLAACYAGLPAADTARGSGVLFMASQLGGPLGVALVTLLLTATPASTSASFTAPFAAIATASALTALLAPLLPQPPSQHAAGSDP